MKRALIAAGMLADIVDLGMEFPVVPAWTWVDCPDDASHATHHWDGAAVAPKPGPSPEEVQTREVAAARAALRVLDASSIRAIREWLLTQPDAPARLAAIEAQAAAERARLA